MIFRVALIASSLLAALPAAAQVPIVQSGNVTPGHALAWITSGVASDAGSAAAGNLTSLGITASGPSFCINSGPTIINGVAQPYNQFCFGDTSTGGTISFYNYNGATGTLNYNINGTLAPIAALSITALTGDLTASGPGSAVATLATVNSNIGSFGSATAVPVITVNGKGLITAVSTAALGTMAAQNASAVDITGATLITGLPTPVNASDAATKQYVDNNATGIVPHTAAVLATAAALPTNTYNNGTSGVGATLTATSNGALTVDGVGVSAGNRIVVKNEAAPANNGIYTVTAVGDGSDPYVLTRATDANQPGTASATLIGFGTYIAVTSGTANAGTSWAVNSVVTTMGTSAINWAQFSSTVTGVTSIGSLNGIVLLGNGLSTSGGNTINTPWTVSSTNIYNNNAGNVGIGTTAPGARLSLGELVGSDALRLFDGGGTSNYGWGIQGSELQSFIPSGTHFSFNSGGTLQSSGTNEIMRITSGGNVGIGTISPASPLDVSGIISIGGTALFTTPQVYDKNCGAAGYDCTTGFNSFLAAVAAGVKGYIPCGTYDTASGFVYRSGIDGFYIEGAGSCTELRGTTAGINVLALGNGSVTIQHVKIENLSVGSSVTQNSSGSGIFAWGGTVAFWDLNGITMNDGNIYDAIFMQGSGTDSLNFVNIRNTTIFNCGGDGLTMFATGNAAQQYVDPSTIIAGCGGSGILIGGGLGGVLLQNVIAASGGAGLILTNSSGNIKNQEIFLGPTFDSDSNIGGPAVAALAGGFTYLACDGCWASASTIGIEIETSNAVISISGAFHIESNSNSAGGIYVTGTANLISIGGGGVIANNTGPAIELNAVGSNTEALITGIQMYANDYPVFTTGARPGYLGIIANMISANSHANAYAAANPLCTNNIGSNTSSGC